MSETTSHREPDASLDWMRQIQTQQRENESSNGVLRNIYKRAKAAGENVAVMRRVIRKLRSASPEEIIADLKAEIYYLSIRKVAVTAESLFADLDLYLTNTGTAAEALFAAQERGYQDGRLGKRIEECPYQAGTEAHAEWGRYWKLGQEAIAREMGPDGKVADGSRMRPSKRQQRIPGTEAKQASPKKKAPAKKKGNGKGGRRPRAITKDNVVPLN